MRQLPNKRRTGVQLGSQEDLPGLDWGCGFLLGGSCGLLSKYRGEADLRCGQGGAGGETFERDGGEGVQHRVPTRTANANHQDGGLIRASCKEFMFWCLLIIKTLAKLSLKKKTVKQ